MSKPRKPAPPASPDAPQPERKFKYSTFREEQVTSKVLVEVPLKVKACHLFADVAGVKAEIPAPRYMDGVGKRYYYFTTKAELLAFLDEVFDVE